VLVTGASGLLGASVARTLLARGDAVVTLQRRPSGVAGARDVLGSLDASEPRRTPAGSTPRPALEDAAEGVDGVVHCAAKVGFTGAEAGFRAVNVDGTGALLAAARAAGATRFVQVSSPSVAHAGAALVGAGAEPASPELARGPYARTKAAGELLALAADAPGFAVVAVRPHIMWGPGDAQLTERVVARARAGRMVLVGDGCALIDSTYLDDAVAALVAALDRAPDAAVHGRAFVVSSGEPRTVGEFLGRLALAGGAPAPSRRVPLGAARAVGGLAEGVWAVLGRLPSPPSAVVDDDPPLTRFLAEQLGTAHWFDQRATRAALGWAPAVGLDEGFRRVAAHYGGTGPEA
jgi:nucleoside-diphosphate-sugar epimerase